MRLSDIYVVFYCCYRCLCQMSMFNK
jgi:hypothetical protein